MRWLVNDCARCRAMKYKCAASSGLFSTSASAAESASCCAGIAPDKVLIFRYSAAEMEGCCRCSASLARYISDCSGNGILCRVSSVWIRCCRKDSTCSVLSRSLEDCSVSNWYWASMASARWSELPLRMTGSSSSTKPSVSCRCSLCRASRRRNARLAGSDFSRLAR